MSLSLIGLGSNLGDRQQMVAAAIARLAARPDTRVVARSSTRETTPVGGPAGQGAYLNAALVLETALAPEALLQVLHSIENQLGRRRTEHWGPRPIDLDLLLYDERVLATPALVVPHPRMAWRRFVLEPAAEIAPTMVHPTTGWTVARLLAHLRNTPPYLAIAGSIGAGKTRLAETVVRAHGAQLLEEQIDLEHLAAFYADPAGQAAAMELEFLERRTRLLQAAGGDRLRPGDVFVSDFWFDQSLAFARVWLGEEQLREFTARWQEARRAVIRPRLLVVLDVSGDELLRRVRHRGRTAEQGLTAVQLERIATEIRRQAAGPEVGPVLHAPDGDPQAAEMEVLAALAAMR